MSDIRDLQHDVYMQLQAEGMDCHGERLFFNKHTLRMTKRGFRLYSRLFEKIYIVKLERPPTAGELVTLLRKVHSPYYLDSKQIKMTSETDAFMCKLAGFDGWIQSI